MGSRLRAVAVGGILTFAVADHALAYDFQASPGPTPELTLPMQPGSTVANVTGTGALPRAGWHLVPSMFMQELYTDNVTLAPAGSEKSDFVTEISPTLRVIGNTRRLKLDLWYRMQNLVYAENPGFNKINNMLQLGSTAELVKDHGFLDLTVHRQPQNTSNTGSVALDNISASNNLTETTTVRVSPYWRQRFGRFASGKARYTFDTVQSGSPSSFSTSNRNAVEASLDSGTRFNRLKWGLAYSRQEISFAQANGTTVFEHEQGRLKYLITRHIAILGTVGYDNNSYAHAAGTAVSGTMWNVGAQWAPSPFTSVEGTVGDRFFGTTYSVNLRHQTRLTDWVAKYTEEPTLTRATLLEQVLFPVVDAFGNPVFNPLTGAPVELSGTIPTQTTQSLIQKTFNTSFRYHLPRNTVELGFTRITRDFQLTGTSDSALTASASWIWTLGFRTHLDTRFQWFRQDLQGGGGQDDYSVASIGLTRNLSRTLIATAGYRFLQRSSNRAGADYTENRVYLFVTKSF